MLALPTFPPSLEYWQKRGQTIWPLKVFQNYPPTTPPTYQPSNLVANWVHEHSSIPFTDGLTTETFSPQPEFDWGMSLSSSSSTTRSASNELCHCVSKPEEEIQQSVPFDGYLDDIESSSWASSDSSELLEISSASTPPSDEDLIPLRPVPLPHQEHRRPINYWRSSLIPEQLEGIYKQLPGSRFPSVQKLVAHIPDPYAAPLPPSIFRCPMELEDLYRSWLETRDLMWIEIILVESWASVTFPELRNKPDWAPNTMPSKAKQLLDLLPRINTVLDYLEHKASQTKSDHGLDFKEIKQNRHNRYLEQNTHPYTVIQKCLNPEMLYVFLPLYPGLDGMLKLHTVERASM